MRKTLKDRASTAPPRQPSRDKLVLRQILVPLDFSGYARQALTCAVPLARKFRAKIHLVHVVQPPTLSTWRGIPGGGHYLALDMQLLMDGAKKHLLALAAQLLPADLRGKVVVREGNPAYEVVAAAEELGVNLIVLSNTGRSGLSRVLLGSTAERIVRHAQCPVLTVRRQRSGPAVRLLSQEEPSYLGGLPWRRILVPLDFSLTSLRALGIAVPLARHSNARLLLLHVIEPNPYPTGMEGAVLVMSDAVITQNVKRQLPQVARRFIPKSIRATSLIGHGRAADVIVEKAEANDVDLIVLSTHGHTGLDRLLMGSTAEQVVRQAKCPVFVVRKPHES